ncbi:MAG: choline ABC transporter ATP-binding protein [Paracoccus sp. (in: a-proteobacteria)]|nr:choline ABC transporter ATP-binding protein [Paracoccus sp. (in: a-proteobacteria)]
MSPAIRFENVSVIFGNRPEAALALADQGCDRDEIREETGQVLGVHDCSLEVGPGEIVVLMGLSGSGKSTLLRAVNGLNPIARGRVLVRAGEAHVDITRARKAALRDLRLRHVSMVFQQFALLPWRNLRDNVALGLEMAGMPAAERGARADAQLELVGLSGWADRPVSDLSGGMQQRVGLARAFATEAPILLMDEPFSALDPLIRARLQDELLLLQRETRRSILFVSHDLDEAFRIGNRIALMEGGRIVQCGTAREIIARPATDYVAQFVAHMNPLAVLRAADLAEPGAAPGTPLPPDLPLREAMRRLADAPALPLEGGGQITRRAVMARLAQGR